MMDIRSVLTTMRIGLGLPLGLTEPRSERDVYAMAVVWTAVLLVLISIRVLVGPLW